MIRPSGDPRNIHEQADLVGRLYRNPTWRKQLLGLTGHLPALSALPDKTGLRPTMRLEARGRELDWLRLARGDVVVVGQPGVGKTALLEALAREGGGLVPILSWSGGGTVVTSGDPSRIADAYRAERPPRIFVDDAHLRASLTASMIRLRTEIGAELRSSRRPGPATKTKCGESCIAHRSTSCGWEDSTERQRKRSCARCMPDSPTTWWARSSTKASTICLPMIH